MKKIILISSLVLITLSIAVFSSIHWNDSKTIPLEASVKDITASPSSNVKAKNTVFSDFIYDIGPRFGPIKKSVVDKARSIYDLFDDEYMQKIEKLNSINIIIVENDKQSDIGEIGYSEELTAEQLQLLQSLQLSTNLLIRTDYQEKNKVTGRLYNNHSTPYRTIVPEKQAEYSYGIKALKKYLKESSEEVRRHVVPEKLRPAKLFFTVSKNGTIENIKLDRTSNYPLVDKKMIELIKEAPGSWRPAENYKGEKVNQKLVVSFGLMGC